MLPSNWLACYDFGMRELRSSLLLLVSVLVVGCGKPAPDLRYLDIGSDESLRPMVFGVSVENVGNADAVIYSSDVEVLTTHIFPVRGSESKLPPKFEHSTVLWQTPKGLAVGPGESHLIPITMNWHVDDETAELVAVCSARFLLTNSTGSDIVSDTVVFVLSTTDTALEKLLSEPMGDISNAAEILNQLRAIKGERAPNVDRVIAKLAESIGA